jgi:2,3-bisphosphoglycerate-dependent phosphoglycerate mutase
VILISDLQCPATVLLACHGEATEAADGVMSGERGVLTETGRRQVHQLVEQVRSRRVAAVFGARTGPAVQSADLAAAELGLRAVVVDGLQELTGGDLVEVSPADLRWFTKAIGEIADVHRGETVLVFTYGGAISAAVPGVWVTMGNDGNMGNDLAGQGFLPSCSLVEVAVDGDGWRLLS